jgi:hypothetical protein
LCSTVWSCVAVCVLRIGKVPAYTQSLERLATRRVSFAVPDEPVALDALSDSHPNVPPTFQRATAATTSSSHPSAPPLGDLSSFSRVHTAVPAWTTTSQHPQVSLPNMDDAVNDDDDDDDDDMWARSVMPTPMAQSTPPTRTPAAEAVPLLPPTLPVPYGSRATTSTTASAARPADADLFYAARSCSTPSPRAVSPSSGMPPAAPVNPLDFESVRQLDQHLRRLQAAAARLPFMAVPAQDSELSDLFDPVMSTLSVSSVASSPPVAPSWPAAKGTLAAAAATTAGTITAAMTTTPTPVPRDPPDSAPRRAPNRASASASAKSPKTTTPVRCVLVNGC